ncbi:Response regulator receiver domain protein [Phycisphaerae bacterium RAS1]|nr:Response regulator receiver domain protein [Phycisphaerae bacterium RAS1]
MDPLRPIVALVEDLFFGSKITGTAAALNIPVNVVRTIVAAEAAAACPAGTATPGAAALLLDLNVEPAATLELIARLKRKRTDLPIIAFASHVQAELIRRAREVGADRVLPRSKFSEELPDILKAAATRGMG